MSAERVLNNDGSINRYWVNDQLSDLASRASNPLSDEDLNELTRIVAQYLEDHIQPD